jgi:MFS family permease
MVSPDRRGGGPEAAVGTAEGAVGEGERIGRLPDISPLDHAPPEGPPELRLLANRPFLFLVLGEGVAALAFWAYLPISFSEAAFRFDATPREMSILLASFSLPFVLSNPIQGALVDRWSPKWMNLLGYLALVGAIPLAMAATSLPWLYASTFMVGLADATIQPSRSALTGLLVPADRLVQANGVLWAGVHLALVVGPLAGGIVQRTASNDVALAAALGVGLLSLPFFLLVPDRRPGGERPPARLRDLGEGFRVAVREPELRLLLGLAASLFLVINVFWALEPIYVRHALRRGGDALSFLWAAHGAGAFAGAVLVSRTREASRRELLLVAGGVLAVGVGQLAYTGTARYGAALAGSVLMGLGLSFYFAAGLALIQRVAGDARRGRVTSVFGVLQEGTALATTLGIAAAGLAVGLVAPVLVAGSGVLVAAGLLGVRAFLRLARRQGVARRAAA